MIANPSSVDISVSSVSGWSVGEHWDHLLKVDHRALSSITSGQNFEIKKPKSLIARIVLFTGIIPRGVRRSPAAVAGVKTDAAQIQRQIDELVSLISRVNFDPDSMTIPVMEHPFLGAFSRRDWIRFLNVHHAHHEKIITDISNRAKSSV